jgi:hypothetical protein
MYRARNLLTGTVGTGRTQSWRMAGRTGTDMAGRQVGWARVDGFFFKIVPYMFHTRARLGCHGHGYHGYGYSSTGTGMSTVTDVRVFVVVSVFFLLFLFYKYIFYFTMS